MAENGSASPGVFSAAEVPDTPIEFSIDGETFHARPWMTASAFIRYSKQMLEGGISSAVMVGDFFSESMESEEFERFSAFIDDPARRVTIETLGKVFEYVFGLQTAAAGAEARPTEPSTP